MSVDITDQGFTVIVEEEPNEVTVVAPGAAGALGYYGAFFSDQDQQAAAINTATAMTLNNTAEANGISIVSGSQVTFAYDGTFDLQFSAQLHHRGGGGNGIEIDIWLAKNGSPVADSATKLVIDKNKYLVAAWDFLLTVAAGDYLELMYRVNNTDIVLEHGVADGVPVDTPSLIVNVMQVMYNQVGPQGPTGATGATGAKGDKGDKGDTGDAATVAVGTTSTLAPGASATVTNSGTSSAAVFDFGIPEGDKGDKGDKGDQGDPGPQGPSGVVAVTAPITNSGTSTSALLGLTTGTGLTTAGGTLAADIGTSSSTVASGDRGLPTGGSTGQVLAKQSASNYDSVWVTPTTDAPVSASYVTLGTDGTLTSERVLTAGTGITVTDAGAGSTVTIATSAILPTVVDAKGDLIAGTGADTVARLAVGGDDTVLMAASGETAGLKWAVPASPAAQYVTLATDSSLSNERVLTAGTGITVSDGGANSIVTLSSVPRFAPPAGQAVRSVANQTSAVVTQSRLTFLPVELAACTLDRIACSVNTGAASTTVRLGIYASDSSGYPGSLILDAGTVDSSTNGVKTITISQSLSGGRYWLAAVAQGGTPTLVVQTNGSMYALGFQRSFSGTEPSVADLLSVNPNPPYQNDVTGALPSAATPRYRFDVSQAIALYVRLA